MNSPTITYRGHRIVFRNEDKRWVVQTTSGTYLADFPKLHHASAWLDNHA